MAKLQAQVAALLGKEQAGTIADAEAKELTSLRAMLAMNDEEGEGDGDEDAEGGDEDAEDEDAEDDEEEAEGGDEDEDASARAGKVLNHAAAKGRGKLAATLAVRVAAGKETVNGAVELLESSPKETGGFGAAAARTPDGVKPGARGSGEKDEARSALSAAHKSLNTFK